MNTGRNIGIGVLAVVALVVVVGPGAGLFGGSFGTSTRQAELGPEYADGLAVIESVVDSDGMGRFTAKAIAICSDGGITRLASDGTEAGGWTEDEYQCGAGSFVVRTEWPVDADANEAAADGSWEITSGADDYGDIVGEGVVEFAESAAQPDILTGNIGYDF